MTLMVGLILCVGALWVALAYWRDICPRPETADSWARWRRADRRADIACGAVSSAFLAVAASLVAVALSGCAQPTPSTISVDPDSPPELFVAAARAVDAWCAVSDRTHWCPELVDAGGDATIGVGSWSHACTDATPVGGSCADMKTTGHRVTVSPTAARDSADNMTGALAHEIGHFGISLWDDGYGHSDSSALMRAYFPGGPASIPWVVDDEAVAEWCREQGC